MPDDGYTKIIKIHNSFSNKYLNSSIRSSVNCLFLTYKFTFLSFSIYAQNLCLDIRET